ncbi:hypothetical protein BD311DRAFT_670869 [Dichomitus squalens]|uniref:DUF7702 domain-containing protein n=1 Tax=Dichomitus squalens TaxID=114155 RepID=A0A4Q9MC54_9APHY|nr:hypothetical protein BD311DRAFT_670869 [Dichomitus squalens]
MQLDKHGAVSIVQIVLYIPILVISGILVLRHGFSRRAGWISLLILALVRIVGGVLQLIAAQNPSDVTLAAIATGLESAGVSPLIVAAIGLLSTVCNSGQYTLDDTFIMSRGLKLLGLLGSVAVALTAYGGSMYGSAKDQSKLNTGITLRHLGTAVTGILFLLLAGAIFWYLSHRGRILKYRRKLLLAVVASLPFLFVRVLYANLGSFAQPTFGFDNEGNRVPIDHSDDPLQKFVSATGDFTLYIIMALVTEYATVLLYTVVGVCTPLQKDEVSIPNLPSHYNQPEIGSTEKLPEERWDLPPRY